MFLLNYLIVFSASLAATVLFMPLAQILGRRMNAWDTPDDLSHSAHRFQIARTGGIAIGGGFYLGMMATMLFDQNFAAHRNITSYMIGGALVFVVGLLDDLHEIRPWVKAVLLLSACLVSALVMNAVELTGFERLDFLLAVLVLMGLTNAFNLMDGMDGLAAGMAIAASLGLLALSLRLETFEGGNVKLILMGASLGFLFFNRPPARIFMGDCGSLLIGFQLAGMGLNLVRNNPRAIIPAMLVLSPFILDTGLAIIRRFLGGKDIFTGDRRHSYDLLHLRLSRVWQVDLAMWGLGLAFSGLGYGAAFLGPWWQAGLLAGSWLAVIIWMAGLGMFRAEVPEGKAWIREGSGLEG